MYSRLRRDEIIRIERELILLNELLENDDHTCMQTLNHQFWAYGSTKMQHAHKYYSERDPNCLSYKKLNESPIRSLHDIKHKTVRSKSDEPIHTSKQKQRSYVVLKQKYKMLEHRSDHIGCNNVRKQRKVKSILKNAVIKDGQPKSQRSVRFSVK